jgi:acyl-coenzyme A thioesterase PaaI-like protein
MRAMNTPAGLKWMLNLYPPYLMTGIAVRSVSEDWRRVEVTMGLHWYNRNYFGTHFGGSLYAMIDPFYTLMLAHLLGAGYYVWERAERIEFIAPGRGRIRAVIEISDAMLEDVRRGTAGGDKYQPVWPVDLHGPDGLVARVEKTLYVKRKPGQRPEAGQEH